MTNFSARIWSLYCHKFVSDKVFSVLIKFGFSFEFFF